MKRSRLFLLFLTLVLSVAVPVCSLATSFFGINLEKSNIRNIGIIVRAVGESIDKPSFSSSDHRQRAGSAASSNSYGTDFDSTWGALKKYYDGKLVWGTLKSSDRAMVCFPLLDEDCVYYVPKGDAFHAVKWCYTLSRSKTIRFCSLDDAIDAGLTPCSKCVEDAYYDLY